MVETDATGQRRNMALLIARRQEGMAPIDAATAFERLFVSEYPRVVAIAQRVLADADSAEDVAQEVFVSFHGRHRADAPYAAAWLHRAAAHTALNMLRGSRRRLQ